MELNLIGLWLGRILIVVNLRSETERKLLKMPGSVETRSLFPLGNSVILRSCLRVAPPRHYFRFKGLSRFCDPNRVPSIDIQ